MRKDPGSLERVRKWKANSRPLAIADRMRYFVLAYGTHKSVMRDGRGIKR